MIIHRTRILWIVLVACALFGIGIFVWFLAVGLRSGVTPVENDRVSEAPTDIPTSSEQDVFVTFSLNMQDFSYPEESVAVLRRALDLHDQYAVPVDVFLTGTIAKYYQEHAPDVFDRLKTDSLVAVSYHVRPPAPYTNDFDWYGLGALSVEEQYQTIMQYETHDIDLVTGEPTEDEGGYQYVKDILGYAPYAAAVPSSAGLTLAVDRVMVALGAIMDIVHSASAMNLGEKKNGLLIRPETVDLKLFEHDGEDGGSVLDDAIESASTIPQAEAPYFVNVKMHDNDFFASASAWTTVYLAKGAHRRPPFDLSLRASALSTVEQEEIWERYRAALQRASERTDIRLVNIPGILELEE